MREDNRHGRATQIEGLKITESSKKDPPRAGVILITRKLPEGNPTWPNRFLRELVKKMNGMLQLKEMRARLEHRFEFSRVFGTIDSDWDFGEDSNKWRTGIYGAEGKMLCIIFDLDWRNPSVKWLKEHYSKIARLEPASIPPQFLGKVIVSNHSCIQQNIRADNGLGDALKCVTENLINLAIETQRPLDRAFYQNSIQFLIPLPQGGVAIVKLDGNNGNTYVPTTLNSSQAEILRLTANPKKPRIPSNHKQQTISGSVVA